MKTYRLLEPSNFSSVTSLDRWAQVGRLHLGRILLLPLILLVLTGCSIFPPTLKAVSIKSVPFPNGRIETGIWNQAPEITVSAYRRAGSSREKCQVKLRAIHDGQAISILASWKDRTESLDRQNWLWNEEKKEYQLAVYPVDQFSIEWPLCEHPSFCMLGVTEEKYDLWTWRGGWTNFSGYADDQTIELHPWPLGTQPVDVRGHLYPRSDGKGLIEIEFIPDSGKSATFTKPRPEKKGEPRATAVASDYPQGSAGDVQAYGVFTGEQAMKSSIFQQAEDKVTPGYWFNDGSGKYRPSFWFVEFYRLFKTATPDEDYQIQKDQVNEFALAIHDQSEGGEHYTTGRIRLKLAKLKGL